MPIFDTCYIIRAWHKLGIQFVVSYHIRGIEGIPPRYVKRNIVCAKMYCKNCKKYIRPIDHWYLFDNTDFTQRVAVIGKCPCCKQDVILLTEIRKSDYKIFHQLEVGKRAEYISNIVINQINYTHSDSKPVRKQIPCGWTFGKAIKLLKDKCWKILRCDWFNNTETIGYIPFESSKIIDKEEYERIKK